MLPNSEQKIVNIVITSGERETKSKIPAFYELILKKQSLNFG